MKEPIIQAATDLIQQSGFIKLTMDDIARNLHISKKTLYKFFKNKVDIIHEVVATALALDKKRTSEAINNAGTWIDKLRAAICFHYINEIPIRLADELKYHFPEEWQQVHELYDYKKKRIQELLNLGIQNKQLKAGMSAEIVFLILEKSIPALSSYDFLSHNHFNLNQAIDEMLRTIFYGILSDGSRL